MTREKKLLVLMVNSAGYEAAWQCTSWAATAAAVGDDVLLVFGFAALRALAAGTFSEPLGQAEQQTRERALRIGAASPQEMVQAARDLGAKLVACETTVNLCGLDGHTLIEQRQLDEVLGLTEIYRKARDARVISV